MAGPSVKVKGLRELQRSIKAIDRDLSRQIDGELKEAAGVVASEARTRFEGFNARSASGFIPRTKGFGRVAVVQTRRSKHVRPDFGALQMVQALIPAAWANADKVEGRLEDLFERLARHQGF